MTLSVWNKLKTPPPGALKKIEAGRLKGKSDISPVWRYQAITEMFGPCGIGWKYEIVRTWTEEAPQDQRFVFVQLNFYFKQDGVWSEPIPGLGGDFILKKESAGLHANDEAYKMATTDALGSALKMIGVAADVYWEAGSKYTRGQPKETITSENKPIITELASQEQRKKMFATVKDAGATQDDVKALISERFGYDSTSKLTKEQCNQVISYYDNQKHAMQGVAHAQ